MHITIIIIIIIILFDERIIYSQIDMRGNLFISYRHTVYADT